MKTIWLPLLTAFLFYCGQASAALTANELYMQKLANGGPSSMRDVAKSLYHTGSTDTEMLDALAEALYKFYQRGDNTSIDATAWAAKALGQSGQKRYRDTLQEVIDNGAHRKSKKYAKKALKQLSQGDDTQYQRGAVDLDNLVASGGANKEPAANKPVPAADPGSRQPISTIQAGMGMQEVYALTGQPTGTNNYQTGKAWIPFNFKGGDSMRMEALYKGQGRIVFSNESHYNNTWRVLEVILDENESGYP